ncbi:MAG: SDR family oxidoreductase [Gammaproteobacteria bacterium]
MNILIIGANSAIARATARLMAARGETLYLMGRNSERLQELVNDVEVRGATISGSQVLDLGDPDTIKGTLQDAVNALGSLDAVLICHGSLPDQSQCEADYQAAKQAISVNGLSVIALLTELAPIMSTQGSGTIAVVTSVAGDRGRQPNFVYGAAKAMVSTYLEGLRGKLLKSGVHVIDIRPGLVDSPMTAHMEKGPLWAMPEQVAIRIVQAIDKQQHTVYTPGYWRLIMAIVKSIPAVIFKRLKF